MNGGAGTIVGGCHCGAVRYEVSGSPVHHGLCHCTDCRSHAGAPFVGWGAFPVDALRLTEGATQSYASSESVRRQFCGVCGTGLFYHNSKVRPELVYVQSATYDHPEAHPPNEHIQVAERIGWMATAHTLPTFDRYPPMDG